MAKHKWTKSDEIRAALRFWIILPNELRQNWVALPEKFKEEVKSSSEEDRRSWLLRILMDAQYANRQP